MRKILLAAFVALAATQTAPAANAACAESHGGTVHVHSAKCPSAECLDDCPSLGVDIWTLCSKVSFETAFGVGFACD